MSQQWLIRKTINKSVSYLIAETDTALYNLAIEWSKAGYTVEAKRLTGEDEKYWMSGDTIRYIIEK